MFCFVYWLQFPLAFVSNFSQWMCSHAWLYRLTATMNLSELAASPELLTKGARVLVSAAFLTCLHFKNPKTRKAR